MKLNPRTDSFLSCLLAFLLGIMGVPLVFRLGKAVGEMQEEEFWKAKIRQGRVEDLFEIVAGEDKYRQAIRELQEINTRTGVAGIRS